MRVGSFDRVRLRKTTQQTNLKLKHNNLDSGDKLRNIFAASFSSMEIARLQGRFAISKTILAKF